MVILFLVACSSVFAQDTLYISMRGSDSLLTQRSLALIAQRYEVDMADADRVQERLFNNPTVSTEWSVRPSTGHFFDVAAPNGQMAVQAEQLFRIAGQRSLAVRLAGARMELASAEYAELAAALRFRLHSDLYRQFYLRRAVNAIGSQLDLLKDVVDAYGDQFEKGNVSLKETTRLRSAYFQLNDQRVRLITELNSIQEELRTLLMEERWVSAAPLAKEVVPVRPITQDSLSLLRLAEANRPQVKAMEAELAARELDLQLQRRTAYPDLALGATYDRNSNYLPNYTGLNAGLSIPLFDRNQGNIKRAKAGTEQAKANMDLTRQSVRQEVIRALADLRALQTHYSSTTRGLDEQLDQLSTSLVNNYVKSNLSLLEFTDLFESYTNSIIAINALKADLQQAYEELEYVTGQRLFDR